MPATGVVFQIERFAVHDGPGIRVTVFLKGCPLRCWWCHSPESQAFGRELLLKTERCIRCGTCAPACTAGAIGKDDFATSRDRCRLCGNCVELCPTGSRSIAGGEMTVAQVMREIERDRAFIDASAGGVTFSGGEPLSQPGFLAEALAACRNAGLHTAIETSGFASRTAIDVARRADLVFFDLKAMNDDTHQRVTGVTNRPIIENFRRVALEHSAVRPRVPLVPGINDGEENLAAVGELVASAGVHDIDLLPYHTAGAAKYARLGRAYPLEGAQPPSAAAVERARATLERSGLSVHIGG